MSWAIAGLVQVQSFMVKTPGGIWAIRPANMVSPIANWRFGNLTQSVCADRNGTLHHGSPANGRRRNSTNGAPLLEAFSCLIFSRLILFMVKWLMVHISRISAWRGNLNGVECINSADG